MATYTLADSDVKSLLVTLVAPESQNLDLAANIATQGSLYQYFEGLLDEAGITYSPNVSTEVTPVSAPVADPTPTPVVEETPAAPVADAAPPTPSV